LRSILSNLLLNAVEYSASGSTIKIDAVNDESNVAIAVTNRSVARLSPEEVARFAEPFWRADQSHQSREHAGLGLALTRAFVEALDGSFSIELHGADTIVATAKLPQKTLRSAPVPVSKEKRPVHAP
jgi:two-component system heavy metal sensor histidine kinase CusS